VGQIFTEKKIFPQSSCNPADAVIPPACQLNKPYGATISVGNRKGRADFDQKNFLQESPRPMSRCRKLKHA